MKRLALLALLLASSSLVAAPAPVPKPQRKPERSPPPSSCGFAVTAGPGEVEVFKLARRQVVLVGFIAPPPVNAPAPVQAPAQPPNADPPG
jgi:hypothetical protein